MDLGVFMLCKSGKRAGGFRMPRLPSRVVRDRGPERRSGSGIYSMPSGAVIPGAESNNGPRARVCLRPSISLKG